MAKGGKTLIGNITLNDENKSLVQQQVLFNELFPPFRLSVSLSLSLFLSNQVESEVLIILSIRISNTELDIDREIYNL